MSSSVQDMPPQPRIVHPQASAVPRLRSPAMEEEKQNAVHSGQECSQPRRQGASPDGRTGHLKLGV